MLIGQRIRQLREQKGLSQADVEKASGLLRAYISRVEHGHMVPSLETLERIAAALDVPLYRLFYVGDDLPSALEQGGEHDREKRFANIRRFLAQKSQASEGANLAFGALAKLFSKI